MNFSSIRKKKSAPGAFANALLLILVSALCFSFADVSADPSDACCGAAVHAKQVAMPDCCGGNGCCHVQGDNSPKSPLPLTSASPQLLLKALPAIQRLLPYELCTATIAVRFSREVFPLPGVAPLARSCIRLI